MNDEQWIIVPNWDKYQHYTDRDPAWVKNYLDLTATEEYLALSFHARGVLHGVWLEYARSHGQLRGSTATLTRRLGDRVPAETLISLNHAGFIEFSVEKPLAHARARARSREVEKIERREERAREAMPSHMAASRARQEQEPEPDSDRPQVNAPPSPKGAASYVRNVGRQDPNLERTLRETFHVDDAMIADLLTQVEESLREP